jgi:hypothetical protein
MTRLSESVMLQNYTYYLKWLLRQQNTCSVNHNFPHFLRQAYFANAPMTLEFVTFIKPHTLPNLHNNDVNIRVSNTKQHSKQLWLMRQRINMLFPCQTRHSILATYITCLSWRVHNLNKAIIQDVAWKHRWWKRATAVTLTTATHLPFFLSFPRISISLNNKNYQTITQHNQANTSININKTQHFFARTSWKLTRYHTTAIRNVLIRGLLGLVKQNRIA